MRKTVTDVKSKCKSRRKPLRDVSNKVSLTTAINKSNSLITQQQQRSVITCGGGGGGCGDPFDRLFLVHSDLLTLIHQIDELVVQAVEQKVKNTKEIECFTDVLKEMHTSLKPWIPRFQKVLSTGAVKSEQSLETSLANMKIASSINEEKSKVLDSPFVDKFDFLVSPSPLVSWRADGGRNFFMLTPMHKLNKQSKSVCKKTTDDVNVGPADSVLSSPEKLIMLNDPIDVSTPYLKVSPPKSCIMFEPACGYGNKTNAPNNPIMHPVDVVGGSCDNEPSSSQPSRHLALKYPELFGIRPVNKVGNARKMIDASPNWCVPMSPPKTCVLMEPSDDQNKVVQTKLPKEGGFTSVVSHNEVIESTPMCKDLDTTILKGKRAGENTLKKELWTRFEAATGQGFHFKASVNQTGNESSGKGFMDLLEEVSCDEENFIV
ncbi:uncharacterized protein [Rutidosis leptorrhynchoides]|uniref:uncharacterized protein n=1 Tax=Rutidosis leptorrhynchoides TaxID=125765 RepID=UPI003A991A81